MAVEVAKTPALLELRDKLASAEVVFDRLWEDGDEKKNKLSIPGIYAERHVYYVLDEAAKGTNLGLELDLVEQDHAIEGYRFVRSSTTGRGRWVRERGVGKKPFYEYDVIGKVQGQPFYIEVKSGGVSARSGGTTRPEVIARNIGPLARLFETTKIGVIFAAPQGVITEFRQQELAASGALFAEFPIRRKDFRNGALITSGVPSHLNGHRG